MIDQELHVAALDLLEAIDLPYRVDWSDVLEFVGLDTLSIDGLRVAVATYRPPTSRVQRFYAWLYWRRAAVRRVLSETPMGARSPLVASRWLRGHILPVWCQRFLPSARLAVLRWSGGIVRTPAPWPAARGPNDPTHPPRR